MNIIRLGKLIDPAEFDQYIVESEKLETVVHKYGGSFDIPDAPCWMQYLNEGGVEGSISFSRHTYKHPILREMVDKIVAALTPIFPNQYPPTTEGVHFMRTIGSIVPHRDEAGRMCCINIGIKNSSSAITKISNNDQFYNFKNNHTKYQIEDGVGYLLNTHQIHAVDGSLEVPRYLITYGFKQNFKTMSQALRPLGS